MGKQSDPCGNDDTRTGKSNMQKECKDEFAAVYNRLWAFMGLVLVILASGIWYTWSTGRASGVTATEAKAESKLIAAQAKVEATQQNGAIYEQLRGLTANQENTCRELDRMSKNIDKLIELHMRETGTSTKP